MPKKSKIDKNKPRPKSLARTFLSKDHMGIPTLVSDDEMNEIDQTIDGIIDQLTIDLEIAPWRENKKPIDAISAGDSPDKKEHGEDE